MTKGPMEPWVANTMDTPQRTSIQDKDNQHDSYNEYNFLRFSIFQRNQDRTSTDNLIKISDFEQKDQDLVTIEPPQVL